MDSLKETLRDLYYGNDNRSRAFRYTILAFDALTIIYFIASSLLPDSTAIRIADLLIGIIITADLAARIYISRDRLRYLVQLTTIADFIVIITLIVPLLIDSLLFLRVFRALRLLRSYHVLQDFRTEFPFFKRNEELINSIASLTVFIFVMTALVYVLQAQTNPKITNYIDALYFTVTALTTTGFGDITLQGTTGRLLSVLIMVVGVALFLRLVQTIFRPSRIKYECPDCGLNRHDPDAVHCKHCGRVVHITTSGNDG